jgi:hypothetical protein
MSGVLFAFSASGDQVVVTNQSIVASSAGTATATYRLGSDGQVYEVVNAGSPSALEQWCAPTANAGNYEARVTVTVGSLSSGTTGSWLALTSTRDWTLQETTPGNTSICTFTVEIRPAGGGSTLTSATIDLEASRI